MEAKPQEAGARSEGKECLDGWAVCARQFVYIPFQMGARPISIVLSNTEGHVPGLPWVRL